MIDLLVINNKIYFPSNVKHLSQIDKPTVLKQAILDKEMDLYLNLFLRYCVAIYKNAPHSMSFFYH